MADKFLSQTGLQYFWSKIKALLNTKQNIVSSPVNNEILITDTNGQAISSGTDLTTLLNDVDAGKNAFMLMDFSQNISATLPSVTSDVVNTSIPNVDVSISDTMGQTWAVASLAKYEVYNGSTRLNAIPVCMFSMNTQKTLRVRMMVAGTSSKAMTKIQGAILLKHR